MFKLRLPENARASAIIQQGTRWPFTFNIDPSPPPSALMGYCIPGIATTKASWHNGKASDLEDQIRPAIPPLQSQ